MIDSVSCRAPGESSTLRTRHEASRLVFTRGRVLRLVSFAVVAYVDLRSAVLIFSILSGIPLLSVSCSFAASEGDISAELNDLVPL